MRALYPVRGPFEAAAVRIDLETALERNLERLVAVCAAITLITAWLVMEGLPELAWALPLEVLGVILVGWLRAGADCTYLLDNRARRIDYLVSFMGTTRRHPVADCDQIAAVLHRGPEGWFGGRGEPRLSLALRDGRVLVIGDPRAGYPEGVEAEARALAAHLRVPVR